VRSPEVTLAFTTGGQVVATVSVMHAGEQAGKGRFMPNRIVILLRLYEVALAFTTGGYLFATSSATSSSTSVTNPAFSDRLKPTGLYDTAGLISIASFSICSQLGLFLSE
jgi:hypothetical protein